MKKIDQHTFKQIRKWLRVSTVKSVARRFDLHESTILNIRGSRTFEEYREVVKAEHPPIKYSLAEDILSLHRSLFDRKDGKYMLPKNARQAMAKILRAKLVAN